TAGWEGVITRRFLGSPNRDDWWISEVTFPHQAKHFYSDDELELLQPAPQESTTETGELSELERYKRDVLLPLAMREAEKRGWVGCGEFAAILEEAQLEWPTQTVRVS